MVVYHTLYTFMYQQIRFCIHYFTLHYITLHCIRLHYITLHYRTTLYYSTLHCITYFFLAQYTQPRSLWGTEGPPSKVVQLALSPSARTRKRGRAPESVNKLEQPTPSFYRACLPNGCRNLLESSGFFSTWIRNVAKLNESVG